MNYTDLAQHLRKLAFECDEAAKPWQLDVSTLSLEDAVKMIRERQRKYASLALNVKMHKGDPPDFSWTFHELDGEIYNAPTLRGVLELAYAEPTLAEVDTALRPPQPEPDPTPVF